MDKHIQITTSINTGLIPDIAKIIAHYAEIKTFKPGFICPYFTIVRKTAKSLFVVYTGCNTIQRTKLFFDEFGGEYAKYKGNLIFPV